MPYAIRYCARCKRPVSLTAPMTRALRAGLTLRHEECGGPYRKRQRSGEHQPARQMGVIVSTVLPNGKPRVYFQGGHTWPALRSICDQLLPGQRIEAISTHRTILRDLQHEPRQASDGGHVWQRRPAANPVTDGPRVDPWAAERAMLARIGRLDLLTPRARVRSRPLLAPRRTTLRRRFRGLDPW